MELIDASRKLVGEIQDMEAENEDKVSKAILYKANLLRKSLKARGESEAPGSEHLDNSAPNLMAANQGSEYLNMKDEEQKKPDGAQARPRDLSHTLPLPAEGQVAASEMLGSGINLLDMDDEFLAFRDRKETIVSNVSHLSKMRYADDAQKQQELVQKVAAALDEEEQKLKRINEV